MKAVRAKNAKQVEDLATEYFEITKDLKDKKDRKDAIEAGLRDYYSKHEVKDIGTLRPYAKVSAAKLAMTGEHNAKVLKTKEEALLEKVADEYVIEKIDVSAIATAIEAETDDSLERLLEEHGLEIKRESKLYFKHIS